MAYSFECGDTGLTCDGKFSADTEDELLQQIDEHYRVAHLGARPMEYRLKQLIKSE